MRKATSWPLCHPQTRRSDLHSVRSRLKDKNTHTDTIKNSCFITNFFCVEQVHGKFVRPSDESRLRQQRRCLIDISAEEEPNPKKNSEEREKETFAENLRPKIREDEDRGGTSSHLRRGSTFVRMKRERERKKLKRQVVVLLNGAAE